MPFDAVHEYTPRERLLLIADALDGVHYRDFYLGKWSTCPIGHAIKKHGAALNMKLGVLGGHEALFLNGEYAFESQARPTWGRLSAHLGLDEQTCQDLFDGGGRGYSTAIHPTPQQAARRIRWVADHKMAPA